MRELSISLGMIEQSGEYLLQLRDGAPAIGAANLIGCFGGKIEAGETPVEAMCRELGEETTVQLNPADMKKLGKVEVESDYQFKSVRITAHIFAAILGNTEVEAKEGQLVRMTKEEAAVRLAEMTPGTRAAFEKFVVGV